MPSQGDPEMASTNPSSPIANVKLLPTCFNTSRMFVDISPFALRSRLTTDDSEAKPTSFLANPSEP